MKPTLLTFALITLWSCGRFNYLTVSGDNVVKTKNYSLVAENDTIRIEYIFSGHSDMAINLFNKTDEVIEVDWRKSAIILGDEAISYYSPEVKLAGTVDTAQKGGLFSSASVANFSGKVIGTEASQVIFPKAGITNSPIDLPIAKFPKAVNSIVEGEKVIFKHRTGMHFSYYRTYFQSDSSPLTMRSFLTFEIGQGTVKKEVSLVHNFHVSELWKSSATPLDFPDSALSRGDRFYYRY